MNLLFSAAQMAARALYDNQTLEIWEANTVGGSFDPTITTGVSTIIIWQCSNGYITTTTGTSHALSYTAPDSSPRRWVVRCAAGLGAITAIDVSADNVISVKNLKKTAIHSATLHSNPSWVVNLNDFVNQPLDFIQITSACVGDLSRFKCNDLRVYVLVFDGLYGSLSDIIYTATCVWIFGVAHITPASIAHLTAIRDLRIYSMRWISAGVDTVLLSASDAVWADANHFSYSAPSMQIGGTGGSANQAPGGSAGADTTDPAVTPGNGNSNTDWQWDAGKSAHKALTGKAAVYYLTHLAAHTWAITYTA